MFPKQEGSKNLNKVLVACEESQAVTIRLRQMGLEAYSCDITPPSGGHPQWHLQTDVTKILQEPWDMILAFPPCTHLASSGARHFAKKRQDGRQQQAIDFFMLFTKNPCPKIAIENPVGIMSTTYRPPDQIIDPSQFGHPVSKKTCLWLKGLPPLTPTNIVQPDPPLTMPNGKKMDKWYYETSKYPKHLRSTMRSKTFDGIADAMAHQWGTLLQQKYEI